MWIYSYTPIYSCTCDYLSSTELGHFTPHFFSSPVKPAKEVPGCLHTHCISSFSTKVLLTLYCAEGNDNPRILWYSCLGNPMNRGASWAIVHGVAGVRHNLATKPPPTLYWDEQVIALFSWYRVNKHFLGSWRKLCCSVSKSCLTLCDPLDYSTSRFPVHHHLLEFAQTHVCWVSDTILTISSLLPPSPFAFSLSHHQGLFQWVSSSHHMAKVLKFQLQHQSFHWVFRVDFL